MKRFRNMASPSLVLRATPAGVDTGKRVLRDEVVQAYGESFDRLWIYVVATQGAGWASASYLVPTTETGHAVGLKVVSRAEWGAKHTSTVQMTGPKSLVVVHHFATPDVSPEATPAQEIAAMQGVERHHVDVNKWKALGYSFVVFPSGRVYEGRGWGRVGAHTPGKNSSAHGIAFAINGDKHTLTPGAMTSFRALITEGIRSGHVARAWKIAGHRDYSDTSCPGSKVYAQLSQLRGT